MISLRRERVNIVRSRRLLNGGGQPLKLIVRCRFWKNLTARSVSALCR